MGNLSNTLNTHKAKVSLEPTRLRSDLENLISFDLDFTENEEYFREDTIALGYDNEAKRLVDEYLRNNKVTNSKQLDKCCSELLGVVFNSSYYGDWEFNLTEGRKRNEYVIHCSYIS